MRIPRIYQNIELSEGITVSLDERAFKHLAQVLRLKEGHPLVLFNGLGGEYKARLCEQTKRSASAEIVSFSDISRESKLDIHLGQCISKGDRFDYVIQKCTELGVKSITPLISKRSQQKLNLDRLEKKLDHWKQIALSATEQCGRTQCINILPATLFNEWVPDNNPKTKLILNPHQTESLNTKEINSAIAILVGPEGGFEEAELEHAHLSGFQSIQLGTRILRTETAPLAIISALQVVAGDFIKL